MDTHIIAVTTVVLVIMLLVVLMQVRSLVKQQREDRENQARFNELVDLDLFDEDALTDREQAIVDTAIAASHRVKDSKRRARQRKADKRNKA